MHIYNIISIEHILPTQNLLTIRFSEIINVMEIKRKMHLFPIGEYDCSLILVYPV